ncbi:uncharacterized protein LOC118194915 [Stegodyphus dumicola]|uniref:uncharacterized protein LOC118194915 n=1 Tax=Stegodyphus dumicola TaxID=202533 RepID=UPI0015AF79AB|nr:uncharacterized protein LOC118194915 [Stegodyphus dumicola]
MKKFSMFTMFSLVLVTCRADETKNSVFLREQELEKRAFTTYRNACLRLQEMANWMSVLFKVKSVWTRSTLIHMSAKKLKTDINQRNFTFPVPERRKETESTDCSSLRSLRTTIQTYVQFQAQLLHLKALLARILLEAGRSRFYGATAILKGRVRSLDVLNRTSVDLFDNLKRSSKILFSYIDGNSSKVLNLIQENQKSPKFLKFLQDQKANILRQMNEAKDIEQNAGRTRSLFRTGDFFQNLGQSIDKLFLNSLPANSINSSDISNVTESGISERM